MGIGEADVADENFGWMDWEGLGHRSFVDYK
jgi:hypothetical protein